MTGFPNSMCSVYLDPTINAREQTGICIYAMRKHGTWWTCAHCNLNSIFHMLKCHKRCILDCILWLSMATLGTRTLLNMAGLGQNYLFICVCLCWMKLAPGWTSGPFRTSFLKKLMFALFTCTTTIKDTRRHHWVSVNSRMILNCISILPFVGWFQEKGNHRHPAALGLEFNDNGGLAHGSPGSNLNSPLAGWNSQVLYWPLVFLY